MKEADVEEEEDFGPPDGWDLSDPESEASEHVDPLVLILEKNRTIFEQEEQIGELVATIQQYEQETSTFRLTIHMFAIKSVKNDKGRFGGVW